MTFNVTLYNFHTGAAIRKKCNLGVIHINTLVHGFSKSGMPTWVLVCGRHKKSKRKKDTNFKNMYQTQATCIC